MTLIISGKGRIESGSSEYEIGSNMVLFRHPNMNYNLTLSSSCFHRRCYLSLPEEVFSLLVMLHPQLLDVPPLFSIDDPKKYLDDFLLVYEHIKASNDDNFFTLLPIIERYVLYLLSPYLIEGRTSYLRLAKAQLEVDYNSPLPDIAKQYSMSYNTFRKYFTKAYGISPLQYRLKSKVEKAKQLLSMGYQCSEVANQLEYPDLFTFSHQFKLITGTTPKDYRAGHIL